MMNEDENEIIQLITHYRWISVQSDFEKLAGELSIADLIVPANPSVEVSVGDPYRIFNEYCDEYFEVRSYFSITPVLEHGKLLGCVNWWQLSPEEIDAEQDFKTLCRKVEWTNLISADTPFIDALDIFNSRNVGWLVVHKSNQIVGTIWRLLLSRTPIFKIILLSLIFRLEDIALQICNIDPPKFWTLLSANRQEMAEKIVRTDINSGVAKMRSDQGMVLNKFGNVTSVDFGSKSFSLFLSCTTFVDKETMITKSKILDKTNTKEFRASNKTWNEAPSNRS